MITEEERKLMEQIEQLEPKVFVDMSKITNEQAAQLIKDHAELVKVYDKLDRVSDFKYRHVGIGPGSVWVQEVPPKIYQAVYECSALTVEIVVAFLTKEERDQYIKAESLSSKLKWYGNEIAITKIVRKTP